MGWIIGGIIAAVVIIFVIFIISAYNGLVRLKMRVKNAYAQIEVQLKQRFDLVPNLVETVKGYAKHESQTFENVTKARSQVAGARTPEEALEANVQLSSALTRLLAVSENYPELKANTNFLDLQAGLKELEKKIAFSRQFYNDTVMFYNRKIMMFPYVIFARMFGFKEEPFFEAGAEAKVAPKVSF
jgi:LemA protein